MEQVSQRMGAMPETRGNRELRKLVDSLVTDLETLRTQFNQLRTDYNAHVHGGVAAGSANTTATTGTTATAVTLNTKK